MMQSEVCSQEEKQSALRKALESRTFARSEQLKAFLRFICEAEVSRPGAPLTEYVIGVEVLGRPEGYSPAEDSSVRTRAYELRQKLERLYTRELPDEVVQISVPKGTYTPHYVHRAATPLEQVTITLPPIETPVHAPAMERRRGISPWLLVSAVLIAALLSSLITARASRATAAKTEVDPVLAEAWGPLAEHDGTVALCLATPLAMVVGPKGHSVYRSKDYPAPTETYTLFKEHRPLPDGQKLGLTFSDNMIAVGAVNAALTAAKTLRSFGTSYQILPERVATISALRGRNAMVFGAPIDSEAISIALADMPLTVDFEPSVKEFVLRDRTTGKFLVPKKNAGGEFTEVFGLLTVRTTNDSDKRRIRSVVFSGITSVGVQGAAEFFSSPATMGSLRAAMAKEVQSGFPSTYQVIVRCTYTNLLLLSFEYYGYKIVRTTA